MGNRWVGSSVFMKVLRLCQNACQCGNALWGKVIFVASLMIGTRFFHPAVDKIVCTKD